MRNQTPPAAGKAQAAAQPIDPSASSAFTKSGPMAALGDRLAFLKGFIKDPNGTASMVPSSHWLEQRVVNNARVRDAKCVIELGPGTGGTTRALLRQMNPQARLLAIELNPEFAAHVKSVVGDPRLHVECGSAERLAEYLAARRLPAPDAVISGIPFSTMPQDVGDRIAAALSRALVPGGRFVAYQWTPVVAERTIPYLGEPKREWEAFNIPPMRVFTWVKKG